jgi:hypothetical protein
VFADLRDAFHALEAARGSPKEVRRAFSRFVDLTQRLTSAMRTDFSHVKGRRWEAKSFAGWNKITEFFKWLRNEDQHELPIRISVHERRFYELPGFPDKLFPFEGTWTLADQMTDDHPDGITFYPVDPATGKQLDPVAPVRVEYQYLIQPHSEAARSRLHEIGTTDVHQLSGACFAVLADYHEYFSASLAT